MKQEHEISLKKEFPSLFRKSFYFECDDGWYELIKTLARYITNRTPHCYAAQIKEKFGSLRIYVDYDYDMEYQTLVNEYVQSDISKVILLTERESTKICQGCGVKLTEETKRPNTRNATIRNICKDCRTY